MGALIQGALEGGTQYIPGTLPPSPDSWVDGNDKEHGLDGQTPVSTGPQAATVSTVEHGATEHPDVLPGH